MFQRGARFQRARRHDVRPVYRDVRCFSTARGFRERVFMNHNEFRQFTNKVFGGWDFGIEDERNAELIHISLFRELRVRARAGVMSEQMSNYKPRIAVSLLLVATCND